MTPELFIAARAAEAIKALYGADVEPGKLQVSVTRKEFEGDFTLIVFPLLRLSGTAPEKTGAAIGDWLVANVPEISGYNCVKGFLNILFSNLYWNELFREIALAEDCDLNRVEIGDTKVGIITSSTSYQYAKEVFGENASILKLGMKGRRRRHAGVLRKEG